VVTHAGHGTVLAAVTAGVPLVCVPMGRDQPAVAARVTHHGLGVAVDPDADATALRDAVRRVLGDPACRAAATRMVRAIEPPDRAATEIEALTRPASG
jgi:UDP:flavonoid glycosyltransferase YjiC (YdhE family)